MKKICITLMMLFAFNFDIASGAKNSAKIKQWRNNNTARYELERRQNKIMRYIWMLQSYDIDSQEVQQWGQNFNETIRWNNISSRCDDKLIKDVYDKIEKQSQ